MNIRPTDDRISLGLLCSHLQMSYAAVEGIVTRLKLRTFRLNTIVYIDRNGIAKVVADLEKRSRPRSSRRFTATAKVSR